MSRTSLLLILCLTSVVAAHAQDRDLLGLANEHAAQRKPDLVEGRFTTIGGVFGDLRLGCAQCHGIDGEGNSSGAFPRLTGQSPWYLYKSLRDYAAGLRRSEIMEPIARQLDDSRMQNVAAYYASISDASLTVAPYPDIDTAQLGGAIAAVGIPEQGVPACAGCHASSSTRSNPIYPRLDRAIRTLPRAAVDLVAGWSA